jgi:hypothetical protein
MHLEEKNNTLNNKALRHQSIIEFQRQEVDRYNNKLRHIEIDYNCTITQAIAPIYTPTTTIPSS